MGGVVVMGWRGAMTAELAVLLVAMAVVVPPAFVAPVATVPVAPVAIPVADIE